ncbi:prepilin-type N-terminal cleavage/methylation domain-containing protein [Planococcus sp. ANT_H30]|uniref:type II secretion system protein n=1 Tax=Planococcus sp. ANT_H30 TaxID=2597347 RepID=UPI0011EBC43D|nr:prepilin-type N-terminal cleavage/methylation domain-containing protein [Planococcus sp. ANT_H30]KAA0957854.1 prepilin-type N-terminal cleavage/methylation domain-containing protein [Planococcus sp. ANT_H30]
MKNYLQKKLNNEKGMTLIELLAVIVIIAIIAAIAIPSIGNIIENSRYSAVKADATNVISAANIYFTENGEKTKVPVSVLQSQGFLDNAGKIPVTVVGTETAPTNNFVEKTTTGLKITTTAIEYSGTKKLTFTGASVNGINAHPGKGSEAGPHTINQ